MANTLVLGCMWGDEAKAKIVDYLAEEADFVVRFQGGSNAGHTIVTEGKKFVFHTVPSGILYPKVKCLIGCGVVIDLAALVAELEALAAGGVVIGASRLVIDFRAALVLPLHKDLDGAHESKLGAAKIGTTKRGIGPAYSDFCARVGVRLEDLDYPEYLLTRIKQLYEYHQISIGEAGLQQVLSELLNFWAKLKQFAGNVDRILFEAAQQGQSILFEGAQGAMLDLGFGAYPYVTSSRVMADAVGTGTGFSARKLDKVIGIYKAYSTRVGEGPFVTELFDEVGTRIRTIGNEFGSTTGRPRRIGWFDAVVGKMTARINALDSCAITCLDVLSGLEELKICIAYEYEGEKTAWPNYHNEQYPKVKPVYELLKGWDADISSCKHIRALPQTAQRYLEAVQDYLNTQIGIVSVGKDRNQTFLMNA